MRGSIYRTSGFFAGYLFRGWSAVSVSGSVMLDLLTTSLNVIPVMIIANRYTEEDSIPNFVFLTFGSSLLIARLLPKIRNMLLAPVSARLQKQLSLEMLRKCFELEWNQIASARTGEFSRALATNYTAVEKIVPNFFGEAVPFALDTAGVVVALGSRYHYIALIPPAVMALYFGAGYFGARKSEEARKKGAEVGQRTYGMLLQSVNAYQIAHQFGNVPHELRKVTPTLDESAKLITKVQQVDNITALFQTLVNWGGLVGVFIYGSYLLNSKYITVIDFFAIAYLMFYLTTRLESFIPALSALQTAVVDTQKIIDLRTRASVTADLPMARPLHLTTPPSINFHDVNLSHVTKDKTVEVLKGLSFSVGPGETIGIVGATGSGKTTIIQLLLRFYQRNSGRILLNNEDISELTADSLRSHIAVISQDANLFNGTVRENIQYGRLSATPEEIIEAARYADLYEGASGGGAAGAAASTSTGAGGEKKSIGLDTEVGESGKKLSGGQKQLVAIARALLKGGIILIMDEPTASLDPVTASSVQEKLNNICLGATTLIVTHKLYTLTNVGKIYYLEGGRFTESGTFTELASRPGKFREQLEAQCKEAGLDMASILPRYAPAVPAVDTLRRFSIVTNWSKRQAAPSSEEHIVTLSDGGPTTRLLGSLIP